MPSADDITFSSTPPLMLPGRDARTGWGRVNADAALNLDATLTQAGGHDAFAQACAAGADAVMH